MSKRSQFVNISFSEAEASLLRSRLACLEGCKYDVNKCNVNYYCHFIGIKEVEELDELA